MPLSGYRLSPLAEADLEEIWRSTVRIWSAAQAERYHDGIIAALEALAIGEKLGRPVDVRAGYLKCNVGSHVIYFRSSDYGIDVVRILHQCRDVSLHLPA